MKLQIKLRWKIFITLLVFSLTPLFAVASFSHRGIKKLGRNISNNSRANLTGITCESLRKAPKIIPKLFFYRKNLWNLPLTAWRMKLNAPWQRTLKYRKGFISPRTLMMKPLGRRILRLHQGTGKNQKQAAFHLLQSA